MAPATLGRTPLQGSAPRDHPAPTDRSACYASSVSRRVFIAALGTETNQFAPFPTGRRGFEEHGVWHGDATAHEPTFFTAPLHDWREAAARRGWTVIEGLATFAEPSGTTVRGVYEELRDELLAGIRAALPLDAVLLNVHGAMVADGEPGRGSTTAVSAHA